MFFTHDFHFLSCFGPSLTTMFEKSVPAVHLFLPKILRGVTKKMAAPR
jgi:hypothetical protein